VANELVCVQDTDYDEYFEHAGKNTVFLLEDGMAEKAWKCEIDANSSSYFDLPDDCWIITSKSYSLGRWMEAYNNDDNAAVEELLRDAVDWPDNTIINFFAKKKTIFQTRWCDFLHFWDEFIAVEDDCPIVISESGAGKEALLFRPIGDIIKINN